MRAARSRDAEHFARLYAAASDPWDFRTSAYEQEKYAATLAALPSRRFCAALEVGCSIGEMTWRLADRCDSILGVDIVEAPLAAARARCRHAPNARFVKMGIPEAWPAGQFDLILLSEVLYFLSPGDVIQTALRVDESLGEAGIVLTVNWLGATDDPLSGDEAASLFIDSLRGVTLDLRHRAPHYRIDRLRRQRVIALRRPNDSALGRPYTG